MGDLMRLGMIPSESAFESVAEIILADMLTNAVNNDLKEILPNALDELGVLDIDTMTDAEWDENSARLAEALLRCLQKGVDMGGMLV